MKYALLIYSPSTADEYGANLDQARKAADPEHGPWVDYTRAARDAGVLVSRYEGTRRLHSLRREDLDARFPGLLDAVLHAAAGSPAR